MKNDMTVISEIVCGGGSVQVSVVRQQGALREKVASNPEKRVEQQRITTTYIYGNDHAKHIYEKVGFVETDVVDEPDCHEVNMAYFL